MKNVISAAVILLLVSGALSQQAQAQAPGSTGPAPTSTNSPAAVPLDGGASLLLAGGIGLGLRRLRRLRKPNAA